MTNIIRIINQLSQNETQANTILSLKPIYPYRTITLSTKLYCRRPCTLYEL